MSHPPTSSGPSTPLQWALFAWGVGGVCLVLLNPILRLSLTAWEGAEEGLTTVQWAAMVPWSVFMLYSEGYRGFHQRFSPRVVARGWALATRPVSWPVLVAPFTCMGLLHATRKRLIVSWAIVGMVALLIVGVRTLPAAWRTVVDVGVVLGLSAGLASVCWFAAQALRGAPPDVPADFPEPA